MNAYQSALSSLNSPVEGYPVGNPLVCRLLQEMFNQRPPKPRYEDTLDVDKVLLHLATLRNSNILKLIHLSAKLAMLMTIANADRASDLNSLDVRFMQFSTEARGTVSNTWSY